MKITENTPERLAIHDFPYLQVFIGLLFALIGLVITFFLGRSVSVHCEKASTGQVNCRLVEKLAGLLPISSRSLQDFQKAEVAGSRDSDGNRIYRLVFINGTGSVPLTFYYSTGYAAKADLAQRFNGFLQDTRQASLDVEVSMEWWTLLFLFIFTGLGGFMILIARINDIEMVRSESVLRIVKTGWLGRGQEEHALREIEGVVLESSFGPRGGTTYRIAFLTADGGKRVLSRGFTSGWKDKRAGVEAMNKFLEA